MKRNQYEISANLKGNFGSINPVVETLYLVSMIIFSLVMKHPFYLLSCLIGGITCSIMFIGIKNLRNVITFAIPALILFAVINPMFSHYGVTRLFKLPDGNYVTLEAVVFGLLSGVMFVSMFFWFSYFNKIISSEKLFYLIGGILPQLSLLFSMILKFIPTLTRQTEAVRTARNSLEGTENHKENKKELFNKGSRILNVMIGWSLENSIEVSDSMKARGYGIKKRTSYLSYKFDKNAIILLAVILCSLNIIIFGISAGSTYFEVNPVIDIKTPVFSDYIFMAVFFIYCFLPALLNLFRNIMWKL